jgi:cytochrome b pre-mRNA-processing protein 3
MEERPTIVSRLPRRRRRDSPPWALRIAFLLAAGVLIAVWGWLRDADSRALAAMNADLRRELFVHTRAEAEALCERPELRGECQDRLEFLSRFPECEESCRRFVALHRPGPTR